MAPNTEHDIQHPDTAQVSPGPSAPKRHERTAPRITVGDRTSASDRKADSSSMKQVRTTFMFLGFVAVAYVAYLVLSGQVDDFFRALSGVNPQWLLFGTICFL